LYFEANRNITEIILINLNSVELIRVSNETQMDIDTVPDGVYFCRIKMDNGRIINRKVVKISQ
jgi:hypothetical protein